MASDEQRALWAAIRAHPTDDTPRLVYADWLEEHGDEPRAEFIRLQIEQTTLFSPSELCFDARQRRLTRAEAKLVRQNGDRWLRAVYDLAKPIARDFNWDTSLALAKFFRGFPSDVRLPLLAAHLVAAEWSEIEPLDAVTFSRGSGDEASVVAQIRELSAWPHAGCVSEIRAHCGPDTFVEATVGGFLTRLRCLDFHMGSVGDRGAVLIADWPQAESLRFLDLSDNQITDVGAVALAESPHLANIKHLYINENQIGSFGKSRLRERFGDVAVTD